MTKDETTTRSFSMKKSISDMLDEMRWIDHLTPSALVAKLIEAEWLRRASQPITEHQPQN